MGRAAAYVKASNAGEWSALLEGRVDLQKYPSSLRRAYNVALTPQGATLRRSGTIKQAPVYDETKASALLPFVFNNDQAMQVEAANGRMRFHTEAGLLASTPVAITAVLSAAAAPLQYTAAGHAATVGMQVVLAGFAFSTNLNGRVGNVTAVAGNDVTVDLTTPAAIGSLAAATSATVYHVATTYTDADVQNIRYVFDTDTLFLFCDGFPPAKLQRYGAYDWRIADMDFKDGPFAPINETTTTLTPSVGTGNIVSVMTAANAPVPFVASASTETAGFEAWKAFDGDPATFWQPTTNQTGWLKLDVGAGGKVVDGYTIEIAQINTDVSYGTVDYAPGDFVLEGSADDITYYLLDSKVGYVVYDNGRSLYFPLKNATAYRYYRLTIAKTTRNGAIPPRVARLLLTGPAATAVTFTASAVTGINNDAGFQDTDVGRLVRFQGKDSNWRSFKILTRTSTTVVTAEAQGDPLSTFDATTEWRLGMFSDTTGYPTCGVFLDDRLYMGGVSLYPDWVVASVTGKYEVLSQTEPGGDVVDDNALVLKLNARKSARIMWLANDGRALLIGTGSGEWFITSADQNSGITARTAKARPASRRGSASVEPLTIDAQILFVQRANRTVREMSYDYTIDGYRAPSLSLFASHFGTPRFVQMDFAAEPLALAFMRRGDGTVAALTYNKEEDVVGWQLFDFNGFVESLSVIPAEDGTQDALWMTVRRTINGQTRRFVERLTRFWDFDSTMLDAHFVDCGVVYDGAPITTVYGLYDYVGQRIAGLADGGPITPVTVDASGSITLPAAASKIVLGIGYLSEAEISRLEAGSSNGTAQGKPKVIAGLKLRLWQTGGGEYAVRDDAGNIMNASGTEDGYVSLEYLTPETVLDALPTLFTGDTKDLDMPQGISSYGSILYRQIGDIPLPMNVISLMPVVETQDG